MSEIPSELSYSKSHEWVAREGDLVTVGITDHAQSLLGDIVYVELPEVGSQLVADEECGVIESVKAASDLYAPLSGEVVAVNESIPESPEQVNEHPYESWFFQLRVTVEEGVNLLDATGYQQLVESE